MSKKIYDWKDKPEGKAMSDRERLVEIIEPVMLHYAVDSFIADKMRNASQYLADAILAAGFGDVRFEDVSETREHCKDCCCARAWKALEITEYTGRSIAEEILILKLHFAEKDKRIAELEKSALLGNATNQQLLDELSTRIKMHWDLNYRTVRKDGGG